jgi:phospholipid transport system substrate-binding protein
MKLRTHLRSALLAAVLTLTPALAFAGPAQEHVKDRQAQLLGELKKGKSANEGKLAALFDEMLDYDTLARESLGKLWEERSEAERAEFSAVLKQLVRQSWRKNLKKIADYDVDFTGEVAAKDDRRLVSSKATSRKNKREEPFSIDYVMAQRDGQWKITDIVTEGSSLVGNYRSQFTKVIKKDGFPALIAKMKKKLGKEGG